MRASPEQVAAVQPQRWQVSPRLGHVSGLYQPARGPHLLVLGHGAGADMHHPFMHALAQALAAEGIATLRYQFVYSERGGRRPDVPAVLVATTCSAVHHASHLAERSTGLWAGGKSMGGRISAVAAAKPGLDGVRGLVFFGFPLHAAGKPSLARASTLRAVPLPMLLLQGTRDRLAQAELIRGVCTGLQPHVTLHEVDGADHGFALLKRQGRSEAQVLAELASTTRVWMAAQP